MTIYYKGRVQGVGFRWRVVQISASFTCTGYVKNLPDGSVELLVEGEKDVVHRMVETVNIEMKQYWYEKTMDERIGNAHFSDFSIQY
ncbi:MAG: acylphosphatase [Opitutae bacterium]